MGRQLPVDPSETRQREPADWKETGVITGPLMGNECVVSTETH